MLELEILICILEKKIASMNNLRPIILCGGSGSRLWPLSRKSLPKQFVPLIDHKSLFDLTLLRCKSITKNRPIIVSNKKYSFLIDEALKNYGMSAYQILESEGRNTAASICYSVNLSSEISKDENLLIMPSDHLIDDNFFLRSVSDISNIDNLPNWITLGIKIDKASNSYGYIKSGKKIENFYMVESFIEKPRKEKAKEMYDSGGYYWNSGIFFGLRSKIFDSISHYAKDICLDSEKVWKNKILDNYKIILESENIDQLNNESIDTAVLEKEKSIGVYPYSGSWSDIGSWDALADILDTDKSSAFEFNANNNFIKTDGRLTAVIGLDDTIVINNDNVTFITKKGESENVKVVLEAIKDTGKQEAEDYSYEKRPWGKFENLLDSKKCKVKRLTVNPGQSLSLQYHYKRSEHWVVVEGEASIVLDDKKFNIKEGESIYIEKEQHHQLVNNTNKPLVIIETQVGTYFGEDDIVRIEDPYNR